MEKVVFHINEKAKWNHLIANVNNLLKDLGNETIIEVVANGIAVVDYIENKHLQDEITKLIDVTFVACRNSLMSNGIDDSLVPENILIVPAGVSELVKRQATGYRYIKV